LAACALCMQLRASDKLLLAAGRKVLLLLSERPPVTVGRNFSWPCRLWMEVKANHWGQGYLAA
jgi:hypothetical protein